jgi:NADPH:quinone reductase-like Zn-dependent oxidoreductase
MGCDFVGQVVSAGQQVPGWESSSYSGASEPAQDNDVVRPGQLRWGFFRGGFVSPSTGVQKGAFAEYVTIAWDLTGIVPDNLSPAQAASIPIPFGTAVGVSRNYMICGNNDRDYQVQALFYRLKLPQYPSKSDKSEWILIWSGVSVLYIFGTTRLILGL